MNLHVKNIYVLLTIISILSYYPMSISAAAAEHALHDHHRLTLAISEGDIAAVQNLIDKKVDINRKDRNWPMNALEQALHHDQEAIADLLFAAGGDVNCPSMDFQNPDAPSYFQLRIIKGDLKKIVYCIERDKRCIAYINRKVSLSRVKGSPLAAWVVWAERGSDPRDLEFLQAFLSYNPNLDDVAAETEDTQHELFGKMVGKTVEQAIRELGTPAMVEILDRHIESLRKQGDRGMQEELGGRMLNEKALEGMLGHFAELDVLTNYAKSRQSV